MDTRKQKRRWLNVAMEVDNVWDKGKSHTEGLMNQVPGRMIVDVMMMFQRYLQVEMIGERRDVGPHAVNL